MGSIKTWDLIYEDFVKLLIFEVNHKQAVHLWRLFKSGSVKLYLWFKKNPALDGLTKVFFSENKKSFEVYIDSQVMKSKYSCWRMSILLHELAHVLQYDTPTLENASQVDRIAKHGKLWKKTVESSVRDGEMKTNSFLRRSKTQSCLFRSSRQKCRFC